MRKRCLHSLFLLLSFFATKMYGQDYASTKEKIYIQTNHVFFRPGEIMFFKAYVVKGEDQRPSRISNVLTAELISPAGTVVEKKTLQIEDGYSEGDFLFTETSPGGIYKIKAYTTWMQNEKETSYFVKEVTLQKTLAPRVLMKLDFPEKGYGAGDEVTAAFSMRSVADQPIRDREGKYMLSIDGKVISTETFKTDYEGKASIKFPLPADLKVNDGLLNVAVDYDGFSESISRSIPIVLNKIDLQFMPEGGNLVNNISSFVAFKALNENGKAADIKGKIVDNHGNMITEFSSYHFGMGKFLFTPVAGLTYKAVITSPSNIKQQYELPKAMADGIVLHVTKEDRKIKIALWSPISRDVQLKALSRNKLYYQLNLSIKQGYNYSELDEKTFPAGIAQLTVYNAQGMPLAERLVFMNEDQRLQVSVTTDKPKYLPREKVMLTIKTLDEKGQPIPSNFSLAVVDDKLWTFADDKQDHILSWLLLTSELKGKVEEPQFYFKKEEPKSVPALDLLMLTHGYRYFDYIDFVVKENAVKYMPDQDHVLSGQILTTDNKPIPVSARVFLINTVSNGKALEINTGKDGFFFFSDLAPGTSYYLFAQSSVDKKQKIKINVLQNGYGYNPMKAKELKMAIEKPKQAKELVMKPPSPNTIPKIPFIPKAQKQVERDIVAFDIKAENRPGVQLNEVVVVGYGVSRRSKAMGYSMATVNADQIAAGPNLAHVLNGRVAGVQINQNANFFAESKVNLRGVRSITGDNQPLYVVNGVPTDQLALNSINPGDIDNITILKDATATALYGSAAANGAVVINSKKFRTETVRFKFADGYYYASQSIYTQGTNFAAVRKFYAPVYGTTATDTRDDFRETVYWNPVVQTNRDGKATVSFYNSDASTTFRAVAEGIGYNGKLGRTESTYITQNALQVDAKIPPYLTEGDKALIPVVIKNNTLSAAEIGITVTVPEGFILGKYFSTVTIPADSAMQVLVPVQATKEAKGIIQFTVSSQQGIEKVQMPMQSGPKGFPVKVNYSGNQSAQNNFVINKPVPGSLGIRLKLFNNVVDQLMNGIESMLREPYGCFEQTSSSTYPNTLVLKYLKESGNSNPAIEQKALQYINTGYSRLIGFETSQHGFEWFGKAPAHEALTAYGLLEFTDMKPFVKVDEEMMERTKKFLLDRRDVKGGFEIKSGGYDQFASVPGKIANTYIVYALTQAGVGKEIQREYESAVTKAIDSKDAYQLAMMAIAANTMKDAASYRKLMDILGSQDSLRSETSVVNSRDASLRVENASLYVMALLKESSPDLVKISKLISAILREKSYYGYGSTQGTVLALQAIVAYSNATNKMANGSVGFKINNNVYNDSNALKLLKDGNNLFTVDYTGAKGGVPYEMELSYNTFTPPNSEKAELQINTSLSTTKAVVGETVRMSISVTNTKAMLQPMAVAKIGIPAGLSAQPWQLKEIMEKNKAAYYEVFDNYLVFYWMGFASNETKTINLDLKAEIPGEYKGKASNVYLYYTPEHKNWNDGLDVTVISK